MKIEENVLDRLKLFLDYAARKQQVVSSNLANAETPGYRAKELRFSDVLQEELGGASMRRTDPRHLPAKPALARIRELEPSAGDSLGYDGNNVDLDKEMTELAENVLKFSVVTRMVQQRMHLLRSVIKEGKGQ
jgi:flagellar basal-body rod protein FlgB